MIRILVKKNNERITSIEVKGHSNSGVHGKDLVCAGVSSVIVGIANNIQEPEKFNLKIESGYALIEEKEKPSYHDEVVLQTLYTALSTLQECDKDYIAIKIQ